MSSISVCSLPQCWLVILRPKMTVILFGWPFGRVGVEQTLAQLVERGSSMKDQLLRRIRPARRTAGADSPPACAPGR
jgi:hypothetical protein